jgi:hypothetical protein
LSSSITTIGNALAAALTTAKTTLGGEYTAAYKRAYISDLAVDDGLQVTVCPIKTRTTASGQGSNERHFWLGVIVQQWLGTENAQNAELLDPLEALVEAISAWVVQLGKSDKTTAVAGARCLAAEAEMGDHLNEHLIDKGEYHCPIATEWVVYESTT